MNTRHLIRLVFVLTATCSFHAQAADKVTTFADLPKDDQLEIRFSSGGCFHRVAYELTFRRATETTVSITQTRGNRVELGQLTLSMADVDGLDELVRFYRSVSSGNCTTSDSIIISQRHNGKIVATEKYTDNTCATNNMEGITAIPALVQRLRKPE
ncbi:MAG: hypothetical protein LBU11_12675 [Zoogloeaceae bacterium]|jgi:hypothetical protein|nr:hypothetical protein [Zoogloeaceae bacterium]